MLDGPSIGLVPTQVRVLLPALLKMRIDKKIWPEFFEQIASGSKNFEIRLADWKCRPGDTLVLREWDPKYKKYTDRAIEKKVTCVLKTKDIKFWQKKDIEKYGLQIISLK